MENSQTNILRPETDTVPTDKMQVIILSTLIKLIFSEINASPTCSFQCGGRSFNYFQCTFAERPGEILGKHFQYTVMRNFFKRNIESNLSMSFATRMF